ncbi:MAG: hypothetical protein ACOCZQ_00495 [Nanoarchaeota archaeon]
MDVKVKKSNKDGLVRLESSGSIREVRINEDFLHPDNESVSVCFMGKNSSGIVSFTPQEIENIYKQVRNKTHLVQGFKKFTAPKNKSI